MYEYKDPEEYESLIRKLFSEIGKGDIYRKDNSFSSQIYNTKSYVDRISHGNPYLRLYDQGELEATYKSRNKEIREQSKKGIERREFYESKIQFYDMKNLRLLELKAHNLKTIDEKTIHMIDFFRSSIEYQLMESRKKIIDALLSRDKYESWKKHRRSGNVEKSSKNYNEFNPDLEDYVQKSHSVISDISDLWEITSQMIRTCFKLPIVAFDTNLKNVLENVCNKEEFDKLINHTKFRGVNGKPYEEDSMLYKLKIYRNMSIHYGGVRFISMILENISNSAQTYNEFRSALGEYDKEIIFYDHFDRKVGNINMEERKRFVVPNTREVIQLAEDSYKHFVEGLKIVEDIMIKKYQKEFEK